MFNRLWVHRLGYPGAARGNFFRGLHPSTAVSVRIWFVGRVNSPTAEAITVDFGTFNTSSGVAVLTEGGVVCGMKPS
jgi:hypothetical protein